LNAGRAITLCWIAKIVSSTRSTTSDMIGAPATPESIVFGTGRLPTNAIAHRNDARKNT
jgi:hypothetical protein